jgi:hypothetical protein
MVHNVNSGHPDHLVVLNLFIALYQNLMRKEGFDMDGIGRPFLPFKRTYFTCFYSVLAKAVIFQFLN